MTLLTGRQHVSFERGHGVRQIVRFNWPFYAVGALVAVIAPPIVAVPAAWWLIASLAASWLIYDRSPLMRGDWIPGVFSSTPRRWVNIHAGFDETTAVLRAQLAGPGRTFDVFDPETMTEPSIARARQAALSDRSERADAAHLPLADASADAVFLLLAAHELRTPAARQALFGEIRRILVADGRTIVAEHLRDAANFAAFGPGFVHFHSRRTWLHTFAQSGFAVDRELSVTPFVRVFVLSAREIAS